MMNMKKLLALLLAVVMVLGMFPMGALADETEPELCTCGLVLNHDGECQSQEPAPQNLEEPELCTCGLAKGHDGECQKTELEYCDCGLTKGHEGECKTAEPEYCDCGLEKGHEGDCKTAEPEYCDCGLTKGHEGDCQKVEQTKCGICGGEHKDDACTYCLLCKTDNSQCTICEECKVHAGDHTVDCTKKSCEDCGKNPCECVEEEPLTVCEQLLAAESVEDMYMLMLGMMETDMEGLLSLTRAEIAQIRARVAELDPESDDTDTQDLLDTLTFLPNGGEVESAYELIAAVSSLEEMWAIMSDPANTEGVDALSYYEIEELRHKANGYYCHLEFPTDDETCNYDNIDEKLNQLVYNKNITDVATYANWSGTYDGRTVNSGNTLNINLTGNVKLNGQISVYGTVNVTTTGNYSITRSSGNNFFKVYSGGKLNITGSNGKVITIKNGSGSTAAIHMDGGTLTTNYLTIDNCKNGTGNTWGGAIYFTNGAGGTIENTTISNCVAGNGSALYFHGDSSGTITVRNSTIIGNTATTGEYDGTIRTMGGSNCKLTIESCTIKNNTSGLNGGGVYWNARGSGAALTITGTADKPTVIEGNYADQGGGMFISGSAITISNTKIIGNKAKGGGGICMQPYDVSNTSTGPGCTMTLNSGAQLLNNTAENYGGGVYMEIDSGSTSDKEKFTINVNDGAVIQGNSAPNGGGIAITQTTGNAEYTGGATRMYHAYVNINGGTIQENTASQNGGAIYINRTKYGTAAYDLHVNIKGGDIISNSAAQNGGAIYVANDTASTYSKVVVSGGTVKNNTAVNGGAVYLSNGNFEMSGGTFTTNSVSNRGGGVYVDNGTYTMTGGTMTKNTSEDRGGAAYVTGTFNMNGGKMTSNTSQLYGGAAYVNGTFNMTKGEMTGNKATDRGGAVYVVNGSFTISNGTISKNESVNGGAAYVRNGTFNMNGGTITKNTATNNGGGIYVHKDGKDSNVNMTAGTISANTAANNGGAAYVKDGNFTMTGGTLGGSAAAGNTALNGGAVYITGGNFSMISGTMSYNTATEKTAGAAEAGTEGYGGGVYAAGGDVIIGVEGCKGSGTNHSNKHTDLAHPIVTANEAVFGGALAVAGGNVYVYCGELVQNESDNRGTGMNVFMTNKDSTFYHYLDSAKIGEDNDHGMVSIGGTLNVVHKDGTLKINIKYHSNDMDYTENGVEIVWTGEAPNQYYLNLPYCPSDWQVQPEADGYTFVGWTEHRVDTSDEEKIRDKEDYEAVGNPVLIEDKSGTGEGVIDFYAVWAPITNYITYTYSLDGVTVVSVDTASADAAFKHTGDPNTYKFQMTKSELTFPAATKSGYTFVGWKAYASNQKISNWDLDATEYQPDLVAEVKDLTWKSGSSDTIELMQNFGDIVMVAIFKPALTDLIINKDFPVGADYSIDENQTFVFTISGTPTDNNTTFTTMDVIVKGDGQVMLKDIPVGTYTIVENNWSWRYSVNDGATKTVDLTNPEEDEVVTFTNVRSEDKWLGGDSWCKNLWNGNGIAVAQSLKRASN